jgi:hypothetical protein
VYTWNGSTYTASGNYTFTSLNATGCINTATLNLTINNSSVSSSSATACDSYTWNGATYTASGNYTFTSLNAAGCVNASTLNLIINNSSTSIIDTTTCGSYFWPLNGGSYSVSGTYLATITNAAYCDSVVMLNLIITPCNSVLNLTCLIQGYWDVGLQAMAPVLTNQGMISATTSCDSIDVELHDAASPFGIVASTRAILNQNGAAQCTFPAVSGNYYIVLKHRNAIQTWSSVPVQFNYSTVSYDFSIAATQAYGDNQVEVSPGVWAIFSGDIVVDENIDLLDFGALEADISTFSYGYVATDLNGDGNVDVLDSPILEGNISNFVFSYHP